MKKPQAVTTLPGICQFISLVYEGYSRAAAPLTQLTSLLQTFSWTLEANSTLCGLKQSFISAPVFHTLIPNNS